MIYACFVKTDTRVLNQAASDVPVNVQSPLKPQFNFYLILIDIDLSKQAQFSG